MTADVTKLQELSSIKTLGNIVKTEGKGEVWLSYRVKGTQTVKRIRMLSKEAHRIARKLMKAKSCDYLDIQGVALLEAKPVGAIISPAMLRGIKEQGVLAPNPPSIRRSRDRFQRMSFHAQKLETHTLFSCPVTGISGFLDLPALPIAITYEHPLSSAKACLQVLKGSLEAKIVLERQVYAGMILSLLQDKHLLRKDAETTATERNMVLQSAGVKLLQSLSLSLARLWNNPNVWNKMPALNIEWKIQASNPVSGSASIAETLQRYEEILYGTLEPLSMSKEEQAKYAAMRSAAAEARKQQPRKGVYIYDAATVQHRAIKDARVEAKEYFDFLKPHFTVVNRILVGRVLKDLALMPEKSKQQAASALRIQFAGKGPMGEVANKLAVLIGLAKNERLLEDAVTAPISSQSENPIRVRTIAEILASKGRKGASHDE